MLVVKMVNSVSVASCNPTYWSAHSRKQYSSDNQSGSCCQDQSFTPVLQFPAGLRPPAADMSAVVIIKSRFQRV